jgi:hypothetical protein
MSTQRPAAPSWAKDDYHAFPIFCRSQQFRSSVDFFYEMITASLKKPARCRSSYGKRFHLIIQILMKAFLRKQSLGESSQAKLIQFFSTAPSMFEARQTASSHARSHLSMLVKTSPEVWERRKPPTVSYSGPLPGSQIDHESISRSRRFSGPRRVG